MAHAAAGKNQSEHTATATGGKGRLRFGNATAIMGTGGGAAGHAQKGILARQAHVDHAVDGAATDKALRRKHLIMADIAATLYCTIRIQSEAENDNLGQNGGSVGSPARTCTECCVQKGDRGQGAAVHP